MNYFLLIFLVILAILQFKLFSNFKKEQRRNRILANFISGLYSYSAALPFLENKSVSEASTALRLSIYESFEGNFWAEPFHAFIENDRNLFI